MNLGLKMDLAWDWIEEKSRINPVISSLLMNPGPCTENFNISSVVDFTMQPLRQKIGRILDQMTQTGDGQVYQIIYISI